MPGPACLRAAAAVCFIAVHPSFPSFRYYSEREREREREITGEMRLRGLDGWTDALIRNASATAPALNVQSLLPPSVEFPLISVVSFPLTSFVLVHGIKIIFFICNFEFSEINCNELF